MRRGISILTITALPQWSSGPRGETPDVLAAVRAAGFESFQTWDPAPAQRAGLITSGIGRLDDPTQARAIARSAREAGHDSVTLHVGNGFESDDEANALIAALLDASAAENIPLYVETHRATVTQDMKRTLDLVARFPELRFTGDFSHWYTGAEMTYGDFEAKLDRLQPVLERVRFLQGRISDPGCIQIPLNEANEEHIARFREFWLRSCRGFLASARPGDYLTFCVELLPASFCYARLQPDASGELREETDRWQQALAIVELAEQVWREARKGAPS